MAPARFKDKEMTSLRTDVEALKTLDFGARCGGISCLKGGLVQSQHGARIKLNLQHRGLVESMHRIDQSTSTHPKMQAQACFAQVVVVFLVMSCQEEQEKLFPKRKYRSQTLSDKQG